jgi:hypothetical protein
VWILCSGIQYMIPKLTARARDVYRTVVQRAEWAMPRFFFFFCLYNLFTIINTTWDFRLSQRELSIMSRTRGLISFWLYKGNNLRDRKCIYSTYSPLSSTHSWLRCSNLFNPSKKNSFGCAANIETGKSKDLSASLRVWGCNYRRGMN